MKKVISGYLVLVISFSLIYVGLRSYVFSSVNHPAAFKSVSGIEYSARVQGTEFQIYSNGSWNKSFLTGVDIGVGKPGIFPGELAITEEEYFKWFQEIGAMDSNVIRVYIPQTPEFYKALYEYNESATLPLYLIQGIYVNENYVSQYNNVYEDNNHLIDEFHKDIIDAVNIIHGNANIPAQQGKASGSYTYDISKYVIGWILGIEWNSRLVLGTNEANTDKTGFTGTYCYTKNASPFEVFLAETAELAIGYETDNYSMQRPLAFCNWITTDPLKHPNEPFQDTEDIVSVDVEHIRATGLFEPGFFASYHAYPYYPDFMSYDPKYQVAGSNPYKEYLKELTAYHTMPVLISEFGLPTSRGKAHTNQITSLNQGYLNEKEQGEGLASMLSDIHDSGCMGGIVFCWQDEWFKTTWNTMDFDIPQTRPEWFNVMSAEQNFGIMTFDTSDGITVDGDDSEWTSDDVVSTNGDEQVSIKRDEAYLYLLVKVEDFNHGSYVIPIDTLSGSGNDSYNGTSFSRSSDFLLVLDGKNNSRLLIDPYYNPNYKLYGNAYFTSDEIALYDRKNSSNFIDIKQMVSRPLYLPETKQVIDKELFTAGILRYGTTDPTSSDFDSLSDFCEVGGKVEIRIPWMMLNVADPSSCQILSDLHASTGFTYETASAFYLGIGKAGAPYIPMHPYKLSAWTAPTVAERLKQSYGIVKQSFNNYRSSPGHMLLKLDTIDAIRHFYLRIDESTKEFEIVAYLLFYAVTMLLYMFVVLIVVNIKMGQRDRIKRYEKDRLLSLCNMPVVDIAPVINMKFFCSAEGVDTISEIFNYGADWQKEKLKTIFKKVGYARFLRELLYSIDVQDICLVIKVAAMLEFHEFEADIIRYMSKNQEDLHLQYTGMLALSLLGCGDRLVKLCRDSNHTIILSYRCLKEIFSAFSGDKRELFGQLLYSTDSYIQRISIKVIGDEGYTEFEDELIPLLESSDSNLLCDTIRTLGQLKSRKAERRIQILASHENWMIRNVAIPALGNIDMRTNIEDIVRGLYDKEWWVRYNSAKALSTYDRLEEIQKSVSLTGDRFAKEILTYVIEENRIYRAAPSTTQHLLWT